MDVGATWKVAAESNVLMTEEEAKARLVLEIAYKGMEETKEPPPPGYYPQPAFTEHLRNSLFILLKKEENRLRLFSKNSCDLFFIL